MKTKIYVLCFIALNVAGCKDKGKEMYGMENLPRSEDVIAVVGGVPISKNSEILNLTGRCITNIEWGVLATCSNLESLILRNNPLQGIEGIKAMGRMKSLILARTYIRDISPLCMLDSLKELNIKRTFVTNITRLPRSLKKLYIDIEIGDKEIIKFKKNNPSCVVMFDDGFESSKKKSRGPIDPDVLRNPEKYIPTWARGLE